MVAVCTPVMVLPIVNAAKFVLVVSVVSVSSSAANTLYILGDGGTYPCCPAVLWSYCTRMHLVYTAAMKVLRVGYVLGVTASKLSNSFNGKMLACISKHTALLITCMSEYGSRARICLSWHYSIL
jgi:hypothetical protein